MKKNKGIVSLFWASSDKLLTNVIALGISIILARLIDPSEFGVLATASVFTVILLIFVEPGMTSSLIQKKDSDYLDFSTIQTFNIVFSCLLYAILFFMSGPISNWLKMPILSTVIKVLGIQVIIGAINSVQVAYVQKNMLFKKYMICSLVSIMLSAAISVTLAYFRYGVWALVSYSLLKQFFLTILTFIIFKCRFGFYFSKKRFFEMFPFSSRLFLSKLIDQGYVEITQLITSKRYSSTDLAFYNKGKSFPELIMNSLNNALSSVMFPYFSNMQDNKESLTNSTRFTVRIIVFICAPMMIGLCSCANSFVLVVLGEKWLDCVPFLMLYCIYYLFIPFSNVVQQAIKALGFSKITLRIELTKLIISIITLVILIFIIDSPLAIALSIVISYAIAFLIECIISSRYLDYKLSMIFKDVFPSFIVSCIMGLIVYLFGKININIFLKLLLQIVCGITFYSFIVLLLRFPQVDIIKKFFSKDNKEDKDDKNCN